MDYYTAGKTLLQPPLFGCLLAGFYELAPNEKAALDFLKKNYSQVFDFHSFLYRERDPEEDGLLVVTHPEEDLLLQNRDKRSELRPIPSVWPGGRQDPLFNALLVWSNECLLDIGNLLGADVTDILLWNELTTFSLNDKLWSEADGSYKPFDLEEQASFPTEGLGGFLPLIGEIPDQDQAEVVLETLKSSAFTYLLRPLPAEEDYDFPPDTRISIPANWLLYHGLWRFGMTAAATKVKTFSLAVMERYGFREYYELSAVDSEGDSEYAPAAALYLAWMGE